MKILIIFLQIFTESDIIIIKSLAQNGNEKTFINYNSLHFFNNYIIKYISQGAFVLNTFDYLKNRKPGIIGANEHSQYAVTIPLIEVDNAWHVLFEVRSGNLHRQPGEICFPGGKVEPDESFMQAATRELCEELLIVPANCHMIAPLDLNVSPSGQMIMPFLMWLSDYKWTKNTDEVAEIFTVPLDYFFSHAPECYYNETCIKVSEDFPVERIPGGTQYPWQRGKYPVYFYMTQGRCIWVLTAKIMKSATEIISNH